MSRYQVPAFGLPPPGVKSVGFSSAPSRTTSNMQTYSIPELERIHAANPRASSTQYRYDRSDPSIAAVGVHGYSSTHHAVTHPIQHLKQTQAERNNARMEAAYGIDPAIRPNRLQYANQQHSLSNQQHSLNGRGGKNKRRTKRKSLKNKKRKKKKSKTMKKKSKKSKK